MPRRLTALLTLVLAAPVVAADPPVEKWAAGSKHVLRWDAARFPAGITVTVELSTDGGKSWGDAGRGTNTGRFVWTVPDKPAESARLRVHAGKPAEAIAIGGAFAIGPSQEVKDYEWVLVNKAAAFAPRDGAGALTYKGKMWFLGGWNPGDKKNFPRICNNEVWSSADGKAWDLVKPNTFLDAKFDAAKDWEGRHTAGYVVHKDRMWIVGGDVNQGHYHNDVWNSDDGKTWTQTNAGKPVPWGPRALHYTVAFGDKIWVMGGQTVPPIAKEAEAFYRDVWNSADGVTWTQVTPKEPFWSQRGMIGGSVVLNGRMWVLGGGTYDTPKSPERKFFNDVWSSADGVSWTCHTEEAPWHARQYHDVIAFDDRMWVLEGYHKDGGNRKDVWYSSDGLNWYEVPNTPWAPRHAASVYVHDGALWMVAGNNMQSDVWKLRRKLAP
jgi:hypothetical protein